jgi:serine/threonine protein kinase
MERARVAARNRRGDAVESQRLQFLSLRQFFNDKQIVKFSVLLLGNIGSHVNITSGCQRHQARNEVPALGQTFEVNSWKRLRFLHPVKMMRPGLLATEDEVRRFRAEARLAAALQHPNIVAIHEVGEDDGLYRS